MEIDLSPNQPLQVTVSGNPPATGYILIQAHAHLSNITLSTSETFSPGQFTTGFNTGVVITPPASSAFLRNSNNVTVPVLIIAQFYDTNGKQTNDTYFFLI